MSRSEKAIYGVLGVLTAAISVVVGTSLARDYYNRSVGWQAGFVAVAIVVGVVVASLVGLTALIVLLGYPNVRARVRRLVIKTVVVVLAIAGAALGVGAAYAFGHETGDWVVAVFVGIGAGIGAWLTAALMSLFVEIADSLRTLAGRSKILP